MSPHMQTAPERKILPLFLTASYLHPQALEASGLMQTMPTLWSVQYQDFSTGKGWQIETSISLSTCRSSDHQRAESKPKILKISHLSTVFDPLLLAIRKN